MLKTNALSLIITLSLFLFSTASKSFANPADPENDPAEIMLRAIEGKEQIDKDILEYRSRSMVFVSLIKAKLVDFSSNTYATRSTSDWSQMHGRGPNVLVRKKDLYNLGDIIGNCLSQRGYLHYWLDQFGNTPEFEEQKKQIIELERENTSRLKFSLEIYFSYLAFYLIAPHAFESESNIPVQINPNAQLQSNLSWTLINASALTLSGLHTAHNLLLHQSPHALALLVSFISSYLIYGFVKDSRQLRSEFPKGQFLNVQLAKLLPAWLEMSDDTVFANMDRKFPQHRMNKKNKLSQLVGLHQSFQCKELLLSKQDLTKALENFNN